MHVFLVDVETVLPPGAKPSTIIGVDISGIRKSKTRKMEGKAWFN